MKAALLLAVAAVPGVIGQDVRGVSREAVAAVENNFATRLEQADTEDRFDILAYPQGVYLRGYGVVFTAKLNLIVAPGLSPFRPAMKSKEIARVRERKLKKLPLLKTTMKEVLVKAAASLDPVPAGEQVVVAVALHHWSWEDTKGLPQQIVLHADRASLLKNLGGAETPILMEEF